MMNEKDPVALWAREEERGTVSALVPSARSSTWAEPAAITVPVAFLALTEIV